MHEDASAARIGSCRRKVTSTLSRALRMMVLLFCAAVMMKAQSSTGLPWTHAAWPNEEGMTMLVGKASIRLSLGYSDVSDLADVSERDSKISALTSADTCPTGLCVIALRDKVCCAAPLPPNPPCTHRRNSFSPLILAHSWTWHARLLTFSLCAPCSPADRTCLSLPKW
jgi:hypothetical protein